MTFLQWLDSQKDKAKSAQNLLDRIAEHKIDFLKDPKNQEDIESAINKIKIEDEKKTDLKNQFILAFDTFLKEKKNQKKSKRDVIYSIVRSIALMAIVFFLMLLLYKAFFGEDNMRNEFYNIEFARGVITFLFAIGTIGSALIIILSVFTSEKSLEESKERFYRAKEILTILIGILGAIVGFYFGTMDNQVQIKPVELAEIKLTAKDITAGKPFTLISSANNGFPPYAYSVLIEKGDTMTKVVKNQKTEQLIIQEITIPGMAGEYIINLNVKDSKGTLSELSKKITVKP